MLKVLLVDDEPLVLEGLKVMVDWNALGFMICGQTTNGEDAIEFIKEHEPDLVLTDIKMPVVDGLNLIKHVKDTMQLNIKFVILSSYSEFEFAQTAMKYNVQHYILKPLDEEKIEDVLKKVHKEIVEDQRTQKELKQGMKNYIRDILHKPINLEENKNILEKANKYLHIKENGKRLYYAIVYIDHFAEWMDQLDEEEISEKKNKILDIIIKIMGLNDTMNIFEEGPNGYGIILTSSMLGNRSIYQLTKDLQNDFFHSNIRGISIAVGEKVKQLYEINHSYETAHIALNHKFFKGDGSILLYWEVKDQSFNYNFKDVISFPILIESIENYELDKIEARIQNVFEEFERKLLAPELIKMYITNLGYEVTKIINDMNGNVDEFYSQLPFYKFQISKSNMHVIQGLIKDFCIESSKYIKILRDKQKSTNIMKIEEYIREHYTESITLKKLATKFYMNPVYLGQLFKKTYGMYFNEYLHSIRIDEAKKLLRRTDMKVYEIATHLGYKDIYGFLNKFDRFVHMTPTQYKQGKSNE